VDSAALDSAGVCVWQPAKNKGTTMQAATKIASILFLTLFFIHFSPFSLFILKVIMAFNTKEQISDSPKLS
jgi:hypothetical protein